MGSWGIKCEIRLSENSVPDFHEYIVQMSNQIQYARISDHYNPFLSTWHRSLEAYDNFSWHLPVETSPFLPLACLPRHYSKQTVTDFLTQEAIARSSPEHTATKNQNNAHSNLKTNRTISYLCSFFKIC